MSQDIRACVKAKAVELDRAMWAVIDAATALLSAERERRRKNDYGQADVTALEDAMAALRMLQDGLVREISVSFREGELLQPVGERFP